jgi:hypothetical protein
MRLISHQKLPDRLIPEHDVIELLGLAGNPQAARILRRLRAAGLPCVRVNARTRSYRPDDVAELIQRRTQCPSS